MGRKKIQITRIMDERNRQVSVRIYLSICLSIHVDILYPDMIYPLMIHTVIKRCDCIFSFCLRKKGISIRV